MLQQTQVATVIDYWNRWMSHFPTVADLAAADEQEVLSLWAGLGYYRRARNLQAGARVVAESGTPSRASEWLSVPGIGRYTAGAIASISQGEAVPLVDGNVSRVMARLTASELSGPALEKQAWGWAEAELCRERPGDWNQALMELGATVCTPKNPLCNECPVVSHCLAVQSGRQLELPIAIKKQPPIELQHHVFLDIQDGDRVRIRQVPEGKWWAGMWEFPGEIGTLAARPEEPVYRAKYSVTNHRIQLYAFEMESAEGEYVAFDQLEAFPMPAAQKKIANRLSASSLMF
jgi:A/G-specific adenine glycosylase